MYIHKSLLIFVLICFALSVFVGCGGDDDDDDNNVGDDDDRVADDDNDDTSSDDDDDGTPENAWQYLTDDQGRSLILHGVNVSGHSKGESGLPPDWFDRDQALRLSRDWGFNHTRYLLFWARIEEQGPGIYEEAYLDAVEERLDWLADAGVHVILDMHQDVWGPFAGDLGHIEGSNGAPEWATITDGQPFIDFATMFGGWAYNYMSPDVMRAFDNFWNHGLHPELQDAYAAMWAHVAERFRNHPAIIGYDIMNEPWQGSYLLRNEEFDQTVFFDFNQRVIDAIRTVDEDNWVFYEPRAFPCNNGNPSYLPALVDPRGGAPRIGYYPHLYPILIPFLDEWNPAIDHSLENWRKNKLIEANRQQGPLLVGEWRMQAADSGENWLAWLHAALAMFEEVSSGWAWWAHNPWDTMNEDLTETPLMDVLVQTYARAVAGVPQSTSYDPDTRVYEITFIPDLSIEAPTEIYIPASRHYPEGWEFNVVANEDAYESDWDSDAEVLSIRMLSPSDEVKVTIMPVNE